jgi:hypothetical protein
LVLVLGLRTDRSSHSQQKVHGALRRRRSTSAHCS